MEDVYAKQCNRYGTMAKHAAKPAQHAVVVLIVLQCDSVAVACGWECVEKRKKNVIYARIC